MLSVGHRRPPKGHDRVADIFIQRASVPLDNLCHCPEVLVHQLGQLLGIETFRNAGKAAHIREQDRQLLILAFHAVALGVTCHFIDQFRWHVLPEQLGKLALAAGLDKIAPGHVQRIQRQNQRDDCGQRQGQSR